MTAVPSPEVVAVLRTLPRLAREVEGEDAGRAILVSGPPSAALELERLLTAGGEPGLVRRISVLDLDDPDLAGSPALVYVIRGAVTPTDERALRRADRRSIPIVCLLLGDEAGNRILPYVRATDVVRSEALGPGAVDALARRIALRAPEASPALARRLPALRDGVGAALVERTARRAALLAALSSRAPGPDLPAIALLEIRTGLRVAAAHGRELRPFQAASATGALVAGLALRGVSRRLRGRLPLPDWAVRAAFAYGGARALGEATLLAARRTPAGADGTR